MAIRLAHLSDIHFGRNFDLALWKAVKCEVINFRPHLLIVSGDIVDNPNPIQLLAAKCELRDFAKTAEAELVVVPGNHDVYASGLYSLLSPRKNWFERIFFNNTQAAEATAEQEYGAPLGFNDTYRKRPHPNSTLMNKIKHSFGVRPSFTTLLPAEQKQDLVQRPCNCSVLLALLDSNKPGQRVGFATGWVDNKELVALREQLEAVQEAYLVRIAIVHHHVLPIAFSGGGLIGAEPLMVLHNAGTVLELLSEHRFDLVLHGHKHVPQFARLDLSPRDEAGYSLAVVAAGSTALETPNDDQGNCFNLITVAGNGQMTVESFFYGDGRGPNRSGDNGNNEIYLEPLAAVKRRALARARERHSIQCWSRTQAFVITETGDLLTQATVEGLRTNVPNHPHCREHSVSITVDSWFVEELLKLDEDFSTRGIGLKLHPHTVAPVARGASSRKFAVTFPEGTLNSRDGVKYRVGYAFANSINMTLWECDERAGDGDRASDWDKGYIGFRVTHPLESLTITLELPPSLSEVQPKLRCRRFPAYPSYAMDASGDAIFPGDGDWVDDPKMTDHDAANLHMDPRSALWRLTVNRPIVGYLYQLIWSIPGDQPDIPVRAEVIHQRDTLLRTLLSTEQMPPAEVSNTFNVLATEMHRLFGRGNRGERWSVEFFAYDKLALALRPVLSRRSWTTAPMRKDFVIPLGAGIAGVAFQQGRIIPWAKEKIGSPFIRPVPYVETDGEPTVDMRTILAIPIFHITQHQVDRPPPWSCVGVVTFGSNSDASRIPELFESPTDDEILDIVVGARGLAHASVDAILKNLDGRQT